MQYGNHIKVCRGIYYHHGIYVGNGQVIHYKSHGIVMTSLEEFSEGADIEVVYHTNQNFAETVNRAYERLGENLYNLVVNNCESFANWCATGESKSKQVDGVMSLITSLFFN